jgi:predicted nucleotidyltransferase component of viral defense system
MFISEVIDQTIIAIFNEPKIAKEVLIKGGTALRLLEGIDVRLSTDIDFSVEEALKSADKFFPAIQLAVSKRFEKFGFDVIDFKYRKKPENRKEIPDWWSGWLCTFKLSTIEKRSSNIETRRRSALIPEGSNTSLIEIEISEYEYCKIRRTKMIQGVKVQGYSKELLVLEKIRAICQQHPDYLLCSSKNRARDFVDIFFLTQNVDDAFFDKCKKHLPLVFSAKQVPIELLKSFWEESFVDLQKRGFSQVQDTSKESLQPFESYLENIRYIVKKLT